MSEARFSVGSIRSLSKLAELTMLVAAGGGIASAQSFHTDIQLRQERFEGVAARKQPAEQLAEHADFLSIGTNDLIQYTLAIDRTDDTVAHLYDPLHPAVLHLVAHTIQTANRGGTPVAVCGEMAGDARLTRLLLGISTALTANALVVSLLLAAGWLRAESVPVLADPTRRMRRGVRLGAAVTLPVLGCFAM